VTSERFRFSALGDEAFVPATATRNTAIFIFEEWQSGAGKYSFGVRRERSEVDSAGAGAGGVTRFGAAASKSFALSGLSASAQWKLDEAWSVATNFSVAERAPTYYELFANGPHAATAAYEVGDDRLSPEKSRGLDLGLRWKQGESSARVGYFLQSFDRFLFLNRTGVLRDAEGNQRVNDCGDGTSVESACAAEILPEYQYVSRKAQLRGWELDVAHRLVERSASSAFTVDVSAKLDITRATDQTTGRPLPRIAPLRTILGATLGVGQFTGRLEVERAGRQDRVPLDDAIGPTAAFTLFNSSMLYTVRQGRFVSTFFVKGSNLTNRVAFNASSIDTIRSLAPLPGRSLKAGVRIEF
jgi:iron complex outermembrane receptor protein